MRHLHHPMQRLSFVLFLLAGAALAGLALFPTPVILDNEEQWIDAGTATTQRTITRIDTACAASRYGGLPELARDLHLVGAYASDNPYSRAVAEQMISAGTPFGIPPSVDFTEREKNAYASLLADGAKVCLLGVCNEKMDAANFASLMRACGSPVGQARRQVHHQHWKVIDNLENSSPWSAVSAIACILFLFMSLLYDLALGKLVRWIRTGT